MKMNLTHLQREIGSVSRDIDHHVFHASRAEVAAEFAAPNSSRRNELVVKARHIRSVKLPRLYTRLHELEGKLPAPDAIQVSTFDALLACLDHQQEEHRRELTRAAALAKLTPAERHALGVIAA